MPQQQQQRPKHPASSHECPAAGCDRRIPNSLLMCPRHWRMVPPPLQQAVYREWRHGKPTEKHAQACELAIAAVNTKGTVQS